MGYRWCPECQDSIHQVPEPICKVCGAPIPSKGVCFSCRQAAPAYTALRSWAVFEGPIREALHSIKYRRNIALGDVLATQLAEFVSSLNWPVELITAVPSGRQRLAERGYNQVALVARPLAHSLKRPYESKILHRIRQTRSQVGLDREQRKANVAGAFQAESKWVSGRNILLLDDLTTTGATLSACAEALKAGGAQTIYALTLARALPRHGLQIV